MLYSCVHMATVGVKGLMGYCSCHGVSKWQFDFGLHAELPVHNTRTGPDGPWHYWSWINMYRQTLG